MAINILEKELCIQPNNDLIYFLLGKCYFNLKKYDDAYSNLKKAVELNPYGIYKNEFYSLFLNKLAISGNINTNRPKVVLDILQEDAIHPRSLYPIADTFILPDIAKANLVKPDFFLVPNWLSPYHPLYENMDKLEYPVVSMIVDRMIHSEEHIKANLVYSDLIICMENYGVELYKKLGFENVIYVSGAGSIGYDPYFYPDLKMEKAYDVIFLGNISNWPIYKKRNKVIEKLESLKSKYNILIATTPSYQEYLKLMNMAKICIDITIDSQALNYRMFQAMGIGALCFAEDDNDMVTELYEDKKDLILYNLNNLDELLGFYLNNPEESLKIAKQGQDKTIKQYTHFHFMKMAVDKIMAFKIEKTQKKKLSSFKIGLYKGITEHYKNNYHKSLNFFLGLNSTSIEVLNNILVEKLFLYEKSLDINLKDEIELIFNNQQRSLIIIFNQIMYRKFLKQDLTLEIFKSLFYTFEELLLDIEEQETGLCYIPEKENELIMEFKYEHGKINFEIGFDSFEYKKHFFSLLKNLLLKQEIKT